MCELCMQYYRVLSSRDYSVSLALKSCIYNCQRENTRLVKLMGGYNRLDNIIPVYCFSCLCFVTVKFMHRVYVKFVKFNHQFECIVERD